MCGLWVCLTQSVPDRVEAGVDVRPLGLFNPVSARQGGDWCGCEAFGSVLPSQSLTGWRLVWM